MPITFDNSYARLPGRFYSEQAPTPVKAPALVAVNRELAREIGVDADALDAQALSGNRILEGAQPIATAYAGHQFGGWNPQLGDGRAVLLGEVVGPDGVRRDIQLKGSGQTMFSRNGDGRALIGAVLREYLVSEAMAAMGIPTTRALGAVTTGEDILREGWQPGAVLTRVAQSHIRVGTFQFFYARRDEEALRLLADHVIARHYPQADGSVLAMLEGIVKRQAELVAKWMSVGFIHGVMNTDNMAISGETIDYGPCAFMDVFHPDTVFSSIDRQGRYAWNNQPNIAHWNLAQLGQALSPLLDADETQAVLDRFPDLFAQAYFDGFGRKIGITAQVEDRPLINALLEMLANNSVDFTLFFRRLSEGTAGALFEDPTDFTVWESRWRDRLGDTTTAFNLMRETNPVFIPRNHRIEEIITAANADDFEPFERLHKILSRPFTEQPEHAEYEAPPKPEEIVHATFCGT